MPTPQRHSSNDSNSNLAAYAEIQSSIACPTPQSNGSENDELTTTRAGAAHSILQPPVLERFEIFTMDNNTGAAMARSVEDSMYITPDATPRGSPVSHVDNVPAAAKECDDMDVVEDEHTLVKTLHRAEVTSDVIQTSTDHMRFPLTPTSPYPQSNSGSESSRFPTTDGNVGRHWISYEAANHGDDDSQTTRDGGRSEKRTWRKSPSPLSNREDSPQEHRKGIPKIDRELDWQSDTIAYDFTRTSIVPRYPSALFRSDSKFSGTQQSDRQRYKVDVRILTVDMHQNTCAGYLSINHLTPEHPELQTYFTGEIIGGKSQKYGFRTTIPEWGATERTDLKHWPRFSAFRPLLQSAQRDLDFQYPLNDSEWWEQDNIFMRWKEHHLVPDHNTRSIAGASFEGFYYICLNQVEGKISGIYFHAKSEKYQQLELNHVGDPGIWTRGISPSVEFR